METEDVNHHHHELSNPDLSDENNSSESESDHHQSAIEMSDKEDSGYEITHGDHEEPDEPNAVHNHDDNNSIHSNTMDNTLDIPDVEMHNIYDLVGELTISNQTKFIVSVHATKRD